MKTTLRQLAKIAFSAAALSLIPTDSVLGFGNVISDQRPTILNTGTRTVNLSAEVTFSGVNLDRDKNENVWSGATPPYQIQVPIEGVNAFLSVPFSLSSDRRTVTFRLPIRAISGTPRIVQDDYSRFAADFLQVRNHLNRGQLVVLNYSQYNIVSIKANGTELLDAGAFVPVQGTNFGAGFRKLLVPGEVDLQLTLGRSASQPLFDFHQRITIRQDESSHGVAERITLAQLMTDFGSSKDWVGTPIRPFRSVVMVTPICRFFANGTCQFITKSRSGQETVHATLNYTERRWSDNASYLVFQIGTQNITMGMPFERFTFKFLGAKVKFTQAQ